MRNSKKNDLVITIEFEPLEFSDQYKVSICSPDLHPEPSHIVIKVCSIFRFKEKDSVYVYSFINGYSFSMM